MVTKILTSNEVSIVVNHITISYIQQVTIAMDTREPIIRLHAFRLKTNQRNGVDTLSSIEKGECDKLTFIVKDIRQVPSFMLNRPSRVVFDCLPTPESFVPADLKEVFMPNRHNPEPAA